MKSAKIFFSVFPMILLTILASPTGTAADLDASLDEAQIFLNTSFSAVNSAELQMGLEGVTVSLVLDGGDGEGECSECIEAQLTVAAMKSVASSSATNVNLEAVDSVSNQVTGGAIDFFTAENYSYEEAYKKWVTEGGYQDLTCEGQGCTSIFGSVTEEGEKLISEGWETSTRADRYYSFLMKGAGAGFFSSNNNGGN